MLLHAFEDEKGRGGDRMAGRHVENPALYSPCVRPWGNPTPQVFTGWPNYYDKHRMATSAAQYGAPFTQIRRTTLVRAGW